MNVRALHKISYVMYIMTSVRAGKFNGQIANAVIQVTSEPATIAVCVNHNNLTHEFIKDSKIFALSVLSEDAPVDLIGGFGFKSGRDVDKFQGVDFRKGQTGAPIVLDFTTAFLECELTGSMDLGTHTMFLGKIVEGDVLSGKNPMTYAYYHSIKGGRASKNAPHYTASEEQSDLKGKEDNKMDKYVCTVCHYVYDPEEGDPDGGIKPGIRFEDLPDKWRCPICGARKEEFEKED
jgi:flavin reductase (DIM6/NTAB) family NADH-FMN oxidoreductase RutF/rubredoxin